MSLTSNLKDPSSPLFQYLAEHFSDGKAASARWRADVGEVETIGPPGSPGPGYPYGTVGTALNWYLELAFGAVRLDVAEEGFKVWREEAFGQHPLQAVGPKEPGLYLDERTGRTVERLPPGYDLFESLRADLDAFLADWGPRREALDLTRRQYLCRRCWALSLLEQVYRAGANALLGPLGSLGESARLEDLLGLANEVGVADCCRLTELAQGSLLDAFADVPLERRHLDPVFAGSADVGGADADFILDAVLIDCKAVTNPKPPPGDLRNRWLWQLLGYAGLDYHDQYGLARVAIYLARQGRLVVWDLSELLGVLSDGRCTSISQVRSDFQSILGSGRRRNRTPS